jgi:hypothetical protein
MEITFPHPIVSNCSKMHIFDIAGQFGSLDIQLFRLSAYFKVNLITIHLNVENCKFKYRS